MGPYLIRVALYVHFVTPILKKAHIEQKGDEKSAAERTRRRITPGPITMYKFTTNSSENVRFP